MKATAILWEDGKETPIDEAMSYGDFHRGVWPKRVIWDDGSWSYAKGWRFSDSAMMSKIGAGAYGDMTVLHRGRA